MKYLAIEAGATHSRAALFDAYGTLHGEAAGGPCNPTAYGWEASIAALTALCGPLVAAHTDVILLAGIAGVVHEAARVEAGRRLLDALGITEARVTEDMWPMLHANACGEAAMLAIAGTGSNVVGFAPPNRWAHVGGRGHVYGDDGSAYALAVAGLRALGEAEDGLGPSTALSAMLVDAAGLRHASELIPWSGAVGKAEIALLAQTVIAAAEAGDAVADLCIADQAKWMAAQVIAAAAKLGLDAPAPVYGIGGMFEHCARYTRYFQSYLAPEDGLHLERPAQEGPRAVFSLSRVDECPPWLSIVEAAPAVPQASLAATELAWRGDTTVDAMDTATLVRVMAEAGVHAAQGVVPCGPALGGLVEAGAAALAAGGRVIYVGAGTSGRLGVLDASECPPTFGVSPETVQGLIAGGTDALVRSIEGAEDDEGAGASAMEQLGVGASDLVVGVAASGNTPYVSGALGCAKVRGAVTGLVTSNTASRIAADYRVMMDTGPELVAGSTRLKAGTAAKIALNIISTGALTKAGYVYKGRMIGMRPMNAKLKERAVRMVAELASVEPATARAALEECGWHIVTALLTVRDGLSATDAAARVQQAPNPRAALLD